MATRRLTTEEKLAWLASASNEDVLRQYFNSTTRVMMDLDKKANYCAVMGSTFEEMDWDAAAAKAEVLRRMAR